MGLSGYEHADGVMSENLIAFCSDDGIYLNRAANSAIRHNTLIGTGGIDVRYPETIAQIEGNMVDGPIRARDDGWLWEDGNENGSLMGMFIGRNPVRAFYVDAGRLDLRWRSLPCLPPGRSAISGPAKRAEALSFRRTRRTSSKTVSTAPKPVLASLCGECWFINDAIIRLIWGSDGENRSEIAGSAYSRRNYRRRQQKRGEAAEPDIEIGARAFDSEPRTCARVSITRTRTARDRAEPAWASIDRDTRPKPPCGPQKQRKTE